MAAPQRVPRDTDDPIAPADLYRVAVEEYRFQTTFNWSRTQYLLAFNAGLFTAAVLASQSSRLAIGIYALGVLAATVSVMVLRTQHDYYRAARDRMRRVEARFNVPADTQVDTTSTLGHRRRRASVNELVQLLLAALVVANVAGAVVVAVR